MKTSPFKDPFLAGLLVTGTVAMGILVWKNLDVPATPRSVSAVLAPAQVDRSLAQQLPPTIQVVKARPKSASEWLVGPSAEADSKDLRSVLLNAQDGDSIFVEDGTYEFSAHWAGASVKIQGSGNVTLKVLPVFKNPKHNLSLKNLTLDFSGKASLYTAHELRLEEVKLWGDAKNNLSIGGGGRLFAISSHFIGMGIWMTGASESYFENTTVEKSIVLLTLLDNARVEMKNSTLKNFKTAVSVTESATFVANMVDFSYGDVGISAKGDYGPTTNLSVKGSRFSQMHYDHMGRGTFNCKNCEYEGVTKVTGDEDWVTK